MLLLVEYIYLGLLLLLCVKLTYRSHPGLSTIIKSFSNYLVTRALRLHEMFSTLCSSAKGMDGVGVTILQITILRVVVLRAMIRFIILVLHICISVHMLPDVIVIVILLILVTFILSLYLYLGCINFSEKPFLPNIDKILGLCTDHT